MDNFDEGSKTERFGCYPNSHYLEELQNTATKLTEAVQTITQTQSEMEIQFDSLAKGLVQTKHDLTLKIEESHMNLEAANKGLTTKLEHCKCDISSAHEEISDLKQKLNDA
eukprot:Platyproteum_vivax@DN7620_c2_g1_i2.p1